MNYQNTVPFEKRLEESTRILAKYPDRIPCIIQKSLQKKSKNLPDIIKSKYLVPQELTIAQLMWVIRKRIKLAPEKALFLLTNGVMVPSSSLLSQVYQEHKSSCGFLFFEFCEENVFGSKPLDKNFIKK
jgi:GABA(A) receptor-associated protein